MRLRSLLFVPADSAKKFQKAQGCGADALILDLEDSVAATGKSAARENLTAWIDGAQGARDWAFWVRVNAFDTGLTEQDLAAVVRPGLDGVILPKCESGRDVARLAAMLDDIEQKTGVGKGNVSMIVLATETPKSMFNLATYAPAHPRLAALTWGAEDLSSAVGAIANRSLDGAWTHPYQLARSLCLMGAAAAEVGAIDTVYTDYRDLDGLDASCQAARRDGFVGKLAIHPDQVPVINRAFAPGADEIDLARRIVAAFDEAPDAGTIGIAGKMYDRPHLIQARRLLDRD